jgi:hypothetical protein
MITEGEASVHFVMVHGDMEHRLQVGFRFMIIYSIDSICPS